MHMCMYTCKICRAWKRQVYKTVKKQEHQAQIYACLWMLINEPDKNTFVKNQDTFLSYWETKEPQFVTYYKQEYFPRVGTALSGDHSF